MVIGNFIDMPPKLGQHFLNDPDILRKIARAAEPRPGEIIIEIGPGKGTLTRELLAISDECLVIAIEKDAELATNLSSLQMKHKNLEIIHGDALTALPDLAKSLKLKAQVYTLIGNIPFYITGRLLRVSGELSYRPRSIVLTLQREVAERLSSKPPHMNLLAATVQYWARPEILFTIPRAVFQPPPKVDSVVLRLTPHAPSPGTEDARYYALVRALFKQPRKTIGNNLRASGAPIIDPATLQRAGIDPAARAQTLSIAQIRNLLDAVK